MKIFKYSYLPIILLSLMLAGCNGGKSIAVADLPNDTVSIRTITLLDSISFTITHSHTCNVNVKVSVDCPDLYNDAASSNTLRALYLSSILEVADTLNLDQGVARYMENFVEEYKSDEDDGLDIDETELADFVFKIVSKITPCYNKNGILSFNKADTTQKNGEVTKTENTYYNIDLSTMTLISLFQIIKPENLEDVTDLLKRKLISQNHVKGESDLIELGYFNLDNLVANDNFFVSDDGITWNYRPYEIACYSVGETEIVLDYESLKPYMADDSVIKHLVKTK